MRIHSKAFTFPGKLQKAATRCLRLVAALLYSLVSNLYLIFRMLGIPFTITGGNSPSINGLA